MYLENRAKTIQSYGELAQLNTNARLTWRGPRATQEDLVRYASQGLPTLLTASDFDGMFGVVRWPMVLRRPEFSTARSAIDELLPDYCQRKLDASSDIGHNLLLSVDNLQDELKEQVDSIRPMEYVAAKKFVESLRYELERKSNSARVARR